MGKSFKRFDRDDQYHDVEYEKQLALEMRSARHRREFKEEVERVGGVQRKDAKKVLRMHSMSDFYRGR